MLGDTAMKKNLEDAKSQLNKPDESPNINRGFELMLRHRSRREETRPKTFGLVFSKVLSLLNREIHFNFELNLGIIKKK